MTESNQASISARPRLRIDGETRADINSALLDMQVRLPLSGMASAELRCVNWRANDDDGDADFPFQAINFGQTLDIIPGEQGDAPVFSGEITGIEERYGKGAPQLILLAEDKLQRLARLRHNRVFEDKNIDEIISQIAAEINLACDAEVSQARETWHQLNESNLAFLLRLLSPYDIALRLEAKQLRAKTEEPDSEPLVLHPQNNIRDMRIVADLNHQAQRASVRGFNLAANDVVNAQNQSLLPAREGNSAKNLLQDLSWGAEEEIFPQPFARTQAEAEAWAAGRFAHQAKRFLHGDILCSGMPSLRSGREIRLQGVSARLQGVYQVVDCRHCFDSTNGYSTRISVQRGAWQ